jgi:hypothetical protein
MATLPAVLAERIFGADLYHYTHKVAQSPLPGRGLALTRSPLLSPGCST